MDYLTVDGVVWVLFATAVIAVLYAGIMQNMLGKLATRLVDAKATSKESARTVSELGYKSKMSEKLLRHFTARGSRVARMISSYECENADEENVNEELLFRKKAEVKYYIEVADGDEKLQRHINERISIFKFAVIIVLLAGAAIAAPYAIRFAQKSLAPSEDDGKQKVYGVTEEKPTLLEEQMQAAKEEAEKTALEEEKKALEEAAKAEAEAALNEDTEETLTLDEEQETELSAEDAFLAEKKALEEAAKAQLEG